MVVSGEISQETGEGREEQQVKGAAVGVEDQQDENRVVADVMVGEGLLNR
jgi:hypothetical protein